MIEVAPNLFVGAADDEAAVRDDPEWYIISAAKEPWHRQALGYTGRGAPKDHAEYLSAIRPGRMILNLVDAQDSAYIPPSVVQAAIDIIYAALHNTACKVLVHCNQGQSRAPTIAMLYLGQHDERFQHLNYDDAVAEFTKIYLPYAPAKGMADYARANWPGGEMAT